MGRRRNRNKDLIRNPPQSPSGNLTISASKQEITYSAPIPPPQIIAGWEQICPGSADRILKQFEGQSNHRQGLETKVVESNIKNESRGQIFAFILFLVLAIGGFFLIYAGKDWQGFVAIISALGAPTAMFIWGKSGGRKQLSAKRQEIEASRNAPTQITTQNPQMPPQITEQHHKGEIKL
jgi:uncharacterized membrane protein